MEHPSILIRSLILLAGQSSRMGSPKHLLPMPANVSQIEEETPLLLHTLLLHYTFQVNYRHCSQHSVTLSVRADSQLEDVKKLLAKHRNSLPPDLSIDYVQDSAPDAGPSEGLLAAWRLDDNAHWLVTGCDYPLITNTTLEVLKQQHLQGRRAVTCFVNSKGWNEPLLAIWSGEALARLNHTIKARGNTGPNFVLKLLDQEPQSSDEIGHDYAVGVTRIQPKNEQWLTSVDTKEEWHRIERLLKSSASSIKS